MPERQIKLPDITLLCVFAVAMIIRMWHVSELESAPFFNMRIGDSLSYHEWAVKIAEGNPDVDKVFYQAPLYPYLLAATYSLLGTDRWTVVVIQALFGAISCVLICDATTRMSSRSAGLAAGLLLACYGPSVFFDSLVQKTAADQFLLCLVINLYVRWQQQPGRAVSLAIGLVMGLLILSRENALILVIAVAIAMMLSQKRRGQACVAQIAAVALGVTLVLLPVAARNYMVGGEFHLTTSQFGPNFYIGNNGQANGMYQPLLPGGGNARHERADATMLAEQDLGVELTPGEVSRYWTQRTLDQITAKPLRWVQLMGRKVVLLLNRVEVTDTEDPYTYAEWSTPLSLLLPVCNFGLLLPLACLGYLSAEKDRTELRFLILMIVFYSLSVLLFYVFGRYRFPLVPLLCPLAGIGVSAVLTSVRKLWSDGFAARKWMLPRPLAAFSLLLVVTICCNWPVLSQARMKSISFYNFAIEMDSAGRTRDAVSFYERSLELNPADLDGHINLAGALARSGRLRDAAREYELALQFETPPPEVHFHLANIQAMLGDPAAAVTHYRAALRELPDLLPAWLNLGVALQQLGRLPEAVQALQAAVDRDPNYAAAHMNLAHATADLKQFAEASVHYQRVLELEPGNPVALECLARVTAMIPETSPNP